MATTEPARQHAGRLATEAAGARLSELFEQHGRMVYGVCRVLLRDAHEAEDAAQQVFLSAHRGLLGGTDPQDPAAWLGTIARNECRARIRDRMTTPLVLLDERDAVAADVEDVAGRRAEVEALCAALAELPPQQREAIVLREFYGLSYDEVRAALGVTDAAVESLLFRARKRLQTELRPARLASGAIALPLALRDTLAAAVPGFSSGSGGVLAKVASIPLVAKLAAAAATFTAAGTIGYVELEVRDHEPGATSRPAAVQSSHRQPSASGGDSVGRRQLARAPVVAHVSSATVRRHGVADDAREDEGGEVEEREVVQNEVETKQEVENETDGDSAGHDGEAGESEEPDGDGGGGD